MRQVRYNEQDLQILLIGDYALHFTELGVAATIVATILFVNAVSACYLRRRILKEGRFFEPFASDMQDSEWVDDDEFNEELYTALLDKTETEVYRKEYKALGNGRADAGMQAYVLI